MTQQDVAAIIVAAAHRADTTGAPPDVCKEPNQDEEYKKKVDTVAQRVTNCPRPTPRSNSITATREPRYASVESRPDPCTWK